MCRSGESVSTRVAVLGFAALVGLAAFAAPEPPPFATLERDTQQLVNRYRRERGLSPLRLDTAVARIARAHSEAMAGGRARFSDGFPERARELSRRIRYREVAENIARNNYPADSTVLMAVQGWLRSDGHRANIEGGFDLTGVGIARGGNGTFVFTQIFVARQPNTR